MDKHLRKQIIDNFIAVATKDENRAELFDTKDGVATTELLNSYRIILRSRKMDELFKKVVRSVKEKKSQGFLYFLHQVDHSGVAYPLYLGIARLKGKSNEISSLFKRDCPRWEYNRSGGYHLSNLNSVVFSEGYTKQNFNKYKGIYVEWAKEIFTRADFPIKQGEQLLLRMPLYLSLIEWGEHQKSFVEALGNTTIKCEESILINLLNDFYPEKLLNKDI